MTATRYLFTLAALGLAGASASSAQCIAQGQNAAVYVADGSTVRLFSNRLIPAANPIRLGLTPAAAFASDPVVCVAYGLAAVPAASAAASGMPVTRGRYRESIEGPSCSADGRNCPPDSGRRLWALTRSGKIYREDDTDTIAVSNVAGQLTMAMNMIQVSGTASRLNTGADNSVWAVGTDSVTGGRSIYKWMGSDWAKLPRAGVNAGVTPGGSPWVIDAEGSLFRFDGTAWRAVPASNPLMDVAWDPATDLPLYFIELAAPSGAGTPARYTISKWVGLESPDTSLVKSTNPAVFVSNAVSFSAAGNLWTLSGNNVTALLPASGTAAGIPPSQLIATYLTQDGGFSH